MWLQGSCHRSLHISVSLLFWPSVMLPFGMCSSQQREERQQLVLQYTVKSRHIYTQNMLLCFFRDEWKEVDSRGKVHFSLCTSYCVCHTHTVTQATTQTSLIPRANPHPLTPCLLNLQTQPRISLSPLYYLSISLFPSLFLSILQSLTRPLVLLTFFNSFLTFHFFLLATSPKLPFYLFACQGPTKTSTVPPLVLVQLRP